MTLQERIDYLTAMSETLVEQLDELIDLNEQIHKTRMQLGTGGKLKGERARSGIHHRRSHQRGSSILDS
jgi:hypothetical protein